MRYLVPLILSSVFWINCAVAQNGTSLWEHNGSTLSLASNGAARKFFYEKPRKGLSDVGVQPGTVLFEGRRIGYQYTGRAYVFSRSCGALGYDVAGPVASDDRSVTLRGMAPIVDQRCNVVDYRDD